jgi:hypothetical protein
MAADILRLAQDQWSVFPAVYRSPSMFWLFSSNSSTLMDLLYRKIFEILKKLVRDIWTWWPLYFSQHSVGSEHQFSAQLLIPDTSRECGFEGKLAHANSTCWAYFRHPHRAKYSRGISTGWFGSSKSRCCALSLRNTEAANHVLSFLIYLLHHMICVVLLLLTRNAPNDFPQISLCHILKIRQVKSLSTISLSPIKFFGAAWVKALIGLLLLAKSPWSHSCSSCSFSTSLQAWSRPHSWGAWAVHHGYR